MNLVYDELSRYIFRVGGLDVSKDLFHAPGDDASGGIFQLILEPLHGVGLASARLPIREDSRVVPLLVNH